MNDHDIITIVNSLSAISQGASMTRQAVIYSGDVTEEIAYSINSLLSLITVVAQKASDDSRLTVIRGGK